MGFRPLDSDESTGGLKANLDADRIRLMKAQGDNFRLDMGHAFDCWSYRASRITQALEYVADRLLIMRFLEAVENDVVGSFRELCEGFGTPPL